MNWKIIRLGDVCHVADINLRKVDCFVDNFWIWACRGADLCGVWILYEEITYNRMSPHRLELGKYVFIQDFLFELIGLLLGEDVVWKV